MPRHLQIAFALLFVGIFSMGFYLLHLKQREEESTRAGDARPIAPPVAGSTQPVTLYIAYDEDGVVRRREASVALPEEAELRAREVVRALLAQYQQKPSPHPIAPDADIKDVYIVNQNLAVIDFNSDFADKHRSGVWVEALTVDSIVATLAANLRQITRVKFLIDGKERETLAGHADLMSLYDVDQVNQLIRGMQ